MRRSAPSAPVLGASLRPPSVAETGARYRRSPSRPCPSEAAGRHLDHRVRRRSRARSATAAGPRTIFTAQPCAIDEDDVDRKAHERRVHGGARRQHQRGGGIEASRGRAGRAAASSGSRRSPPSVATGCLRRVRSSARQPSEHSRHQVPADALAVRWYSTSALSTRSSISARTIERDVGDQDDGRGSTASDARRGTRRA